MQQRAPFELWNYLIIPFEIGILFSRTSFDATYQREREMTTVTRQAYLHFQQDGQQPAIYGMQLEWIDDHNL